MPKRSIRSQFLADRKSRPLADCSALSAAVQNRFLQSSLFRDAGCLALYSAIHNEVLTDTVAGRALELGKTLVYPRIKESQLEFLPVPDLAELAVGTYGVLEPQGRSPVPVAEIDLIVVPGVVFDQSGHRLGYGRGFYDRALAACRDDCMKVGFAYDSQLVAQLPVAPHDKTLSVLMTESHTLYFAA